MSQSVQDRNLMGYVICNFLAELCGLFSLRFFLQYAHEFSELKTSWALAAVAASSFCAYFLYTRAYVGKQSYLAEQTLRREQLLMSAVLNTHPVLLRALVERHLQAQKLNDAKSGIVPSSNPADLVASRITGHTFSRVEFELDYSSAKYLALLAGATLLVPFLVRILACTEKTANLCRAWGFPPFDSHPFLPVVLMVIPYVASGFTLWALRRHISRKRQGGDEIALKLDQENAVAREFLHGWNEIRHANAFAFARHKIATSFSTTRGIRLALSDAYALSSGCNYLITFVVSTVTLAFAWCNAVDFPVIATFVTLNAWFTTKLSNYFDLRIRRDQQDYANGLLVDLTHLPPSDNAPQQPVANSPDFEFRDVTLALPDGKSILRNASLAIRPGEHVGIVGLTGAGKTTLIRTMLGDLPPTSGELLVKGIPASKLGLGQLSEWIGVLPQRQSIFNATVRENILLRTGEDSVKSKISDADIKEILHRTSLDQDLVRHQADAADILDLRISAHGTNLSVGETAKIAMARLLVRDCGILVFDEFDSALDEASKNTLSHLIREIAAGKTLILVSHHPTDLKDMDRILVLDEGKLASGTYDELINRPGLFARLHALETGIDSDAAHATESVYDDTLEGVRKNLQCSRVFARLNWTQTARLAARAEVIRRPAGECVLRRGDPGDTMFSIISGEVEVNGRTLGPLDSFGEIALFAENATRTADVTCKTDCTFAQLSRAAVMELCETEPSAAVELLKATATIAAREA